MCIRDRSFPFLEKVLDADKIDEIDNFYHTQLEEVIRVCYESSNRTEAGIKLYNVSRNKKKNVNDVDRLSKFLQSFNLDWETIERKMKNDFSLL